MKKAGIYMLITGSLSIVTFLCYVFFVGPWPGDTVSEKTVTSGTLGTYSIGSTKEEIMEKNFNYAFSPSPKPAACQKNWIDIKEITPTQRNCFFDSDEWEVGHVEPGVCNDKKDFHVTLYFTQEKLNRIIIRCTLAI